VNMGDSINTPGNERTPFLDSAGNLYFASDGHIGMGGLDIYKATQDTNGNWQVINAGVPVNSPQDDFTPYFTKGYKGYFASNRLLGKGSDDIYRFDAARILIFKLEGEVLHRETGLPINNAEVTLTNLTSNAPVTAITGTDGTFSFPLDSVTSYRLAATKTGYIPSITESVTTVGLQESTVIHKTLYLDAIIIPPPVIEPIYYNFDRSNIRGDAENPLNHIVQLMQENPNWHLDITSHTDSRGSDSYNMKLSERRAQAALKYLIAHGIDASRLTAQGYGETRLVNNCSNGVPCSAREHQLNRRSEFKVLDK
jgi:peptidoglycan-associated lipoprotein